MTDDRKQMKEFPIPNPQPAGSEDRRWEDQKIRSWEVGKLKKDRQLIIEGSDPNDLNDPNVRKDINL